MTLQELNSENDKELIKLIGGKMVKNFGRLTESIVEVFSFITESIFKNKIG